MNVRCSPGRRDRQHGFSLIEVMIVMVLLTIIVIGLLAMFDQTQRAFKTGMSQVDVTGTGRAVMDVMVRDLEQMTAYPGGSGSNVVNFAAYNLYPKLEPLRQELPGLTPGGIRQERTNILQAFFLVSRVNQTWTGTGYIVDGGADGVGSLYSYTTNVSERFLSSWTGGARLGLFYAFTNDYGRFLNKQPNPFRRVADGVIELKLLAYATNGVLVDPDFVYPAPDRINVFSGRINAWDDPFPVAIGTDFRSNALPSAVEIELGMVEPDVMERVRSLPSVPDANGNETIRRDYLYKQAGKVHLFRQRILIREMDSDAYAYQ